MNDLLSQRASGILLHPTSLPGPHGIGDFGPQAYAFIDFLARAGQSVWQILPLNPTGYGDSPYSAFSAFAGNPLLIDLQQLVDAELLHAEDLPTTEADGLPVNFGRVRQQKLFLLQIAAERFTQMADADLRQRFEEFCQQNQHWLDDYCLFQCLRDQYDHAHWNQWPEAVRLRDEATLAALRTELAAPLACQRFMQFTFVTQWQQLHAYATEKGVQLFGDIPIFVADNSADVWARPELFKLDRAGQPAVVAGVPPDYFSASGQRWGNPLYNWHERPEAVFSWWEERFRWNLELFDLIRIDHFRGFVACWEIPADEETAINGQWVPAPGEALFSRLQQKLGPMPVVAEDLGVITDEVCALRDRWGFPGMKILQFAFDSGPDNPYLPHNLPVQSVIYTGTHDNNTTRGWWDGLPPHQQQQVFDYLGYPPTDIPQAMIRTALASVSQLCILPMQDLLGLDADARLNCPGQATGNWSWRMTRDAPSSGLADHLATLTYRYGRKPAG